MKKTVKEEHKASSFAISKEALDNLPIAVIDTKENLDLFKINKRARSLFGLAKEGFDGVSTLYDFIIAEHKARLDACIDALKTTNTACEATLTLLRQDGLHVPASLRITPRDAKHTESGFRFYIIERWMPIELRHETAYNETILQEIIDNSHDGICLVGDDYRFEYVNERGCEIFGGKREDIIGHDFREFMTPEVAEIVGQRYDQRRKGEQVPDIYSFQILRKDGSPRDVEIRVSLVRTPNGSPKTVVHVLDITKQEKDRKALVDSETRYRKLVETMNDGLAIDDENGVLIYANDAFCNMLGYSPDQIIGRPWIEFARAMDASLVKRKLEDRKAGKTENYELEWIRSTGEIVPTIIAAAPYFDQDEKFQGSFAVVTDISDQKMAEETVQFYLDLITHDIANQLQVIITSAGLLDSELPRTYKDDAQEDILDAVEHCNRLITKVKRAGQLRYIPHTSVDLMSIVREKAAIIERVYGAKVHMEGFNSPLNVRADYLLGELVWNIFENAARHNPGEDKQVWIAGESNGGVVKLLVSDNGPGISNTKKKQLFDRKRRTGGVGLTLVAQMIRKYGGAIKVFDRIDGDPNQGTQIELSFQRPFD